VVIGCGPSGVIAAISVACCGEWVSTGVTRLSNLDTIGRGVSVLAGIVLDGIVLAGVALDGIALGEVTLAGIALGGIVLAAVVLDEVVLAGIVLDEVVLGATAGALGVVWAGCATAAPG
jgi:hypothetical protein